MTLSEGKALGIISSTRESTFALIGRHGFRAIDTHGMERDIVGNLFEPAYDEQVLFCGFPEKAEGFLCFHENGPLYPSYAGFISRREPDEGNTESLHVLAGAFGVNLRVSR